MAIIGDEKQPSSDSSSNREKSSTPDLLMDTEKALAGQAPMPVNQDPPAPQGKMNPKEVDVGSQDEETDPMAHLSDREREIIKRQIDTPDVKVTIRMLYRYATWNDILIIIISAICAIAGGAALPLMTVSFDLLFWFSSRTILTRCRSSLAVLLEHFKVFFMAAA
jgi:ATP-binding cassette, subfamily B (MDR/TAP), member 1